MDQKDGSNALSLPRWESFLIDGNEFGGDFPIGPYNRMIAKLYGTGSESSQTINKLKLDKGGQSKSPKKSVSINVQPGQEDALYRPGLSGPPFSNGVKQVDKPTSMVGRPAQPKHLDLPIDIVPQSKMDKISTSSVSGEGELKEIADKVKADDAPAGIIFMCNKMTRQTCFQYRLFGLPSSQAQLVKRIVPGTLLFLFVVDTRELHGIFEATSNGGLNLDPTAFRGAFPSQVRFRVCRDCKPLHERDFKHTIEGNYFTPIKFRSELTSQQVSAILQLFCPGGFVNERIKMHENSFLNVSKIGGEWACSALDAAECQSEKSMDISPQHEKSPTVERQNNIYVEERGYMTNARNENGLYGLDASKNYVVSSSYGCSGQNRGSNVQDSLYPSYMPSSSHLSNGKILGQMFSDKDIEKGKFYAYDRANAYDDHISKPRSWFEETESACKGEPNRISQSNQDLFGIDELGVSEQLRVEHFSRVRHMYEKEHLSRQDLNIYASHDLLHGQVEESNFHTHKRALEDTVSNSSNTYPWKRPHYFNDSYEDIMLKEQNQLSNLAPVNVDRMRQASEAGNRVDESNASQLFSNIRRV